MPTKSRPSRKVLATAAESGWPGVISTLRAGCHFNLAPTFTFIGQLVEIDRCVAAIASEPR